MALAQKYEQRQTCIPEEYLAWEREQETRHEYVDGEILAMADESPEHNEIAGNIHFQFKLAFRGRPCKVYMEGVRVRVSPTRYRYPDVVAVCGEIAFAETNPRTLLNPTVIFEVLSPSTGLQDATDKLAEYTQLASVTDYVIVAQTQSLVIHHRRQSGQAWATRLHMQPDDRIRFESLDVTLTVADCYEGIIFPPPDSADNTGETENSAELQTH